jgi:hypothetical protein
MQTLEWLYQKMTQAGQACTLLVLLSLAAGYSYAGKYLATRAEVTQMEQSISKGFAVLSARIDLSDADGRVRDSLNQVRAKERELADLEMVMQEIDSNDAATILRNRVFSTRQELGELNQRLAEAVQNRQEAERVYRQVSR